MKQHSNNNESLIRIFIRLGDQPTNIDPNDIDLIAKYIYNCYNLDTYSGTSFEALFSQLLNVTTVPAKKSGMNCMKFCKCGESKYKNTLF